MSKIRRLLKPFLIILCVALVYTSFKPPKPTFAQSASPTPGSGTFDIDCPGGVGDVAALTNAVTTADSDNQPDTINLTAGCIYSLSSELLISDDGANNGITFNGNGAVLDGNNATRLVEISVGASVNLTDLTLQHGGVVTYAGAVLNRGIFTVSDSTFSNNHVSDAGGAIVTYGTLTITGSTFSNNQVANYGGAISVGDGTATITNSTFSGNAVTSTGAGGAIRSDGQLTLINSTIVNGSSGYNGSALYMSNGAMTLRNTLIAGNSSGACNLQTGTFNATDNNLSDDNTCTGTQPVTTAQLNLGTLGDNGGSTQTVPLLPGSVAIGAGDPALCPSTDQRGVARKSPCDVGAYETAPTNQVSWQQLNPGGTLPPPRGASARGYDEVNDRLILFGGGESYPPYNDVWVLSNASGVSGTPSWQQLSPTGTAPQTRNEHSAVYDPNSNRLIIHGGCGGNCSPALADTWVLTNANGLGGTPQWIQLPSAPVARIGHYAGYDPSSNRMIVFGGDQAFPSTYLNDVWVLSNANGLGDTPTWTQLSPAGTPPAPRGEQTSAVYDPTSNRLMVVDGASTTYTVLTLYDDVWVLSNANGLGGTPTWTQLSPTGTAPTVRRNHSVVYDSSTNRLILFGGYNDNSNTTFNDTWVLTNANGLGGTPQWIPITPSGILPGTRQAHLAAYSQATKRMVITTGYDDKSTFYNDDWVLTNADGSGVTSATSTPTFMPPTATLTLTDTSTATLTSTATSTPTFMPPTATLTLTDTPTATLTSTATSTLSCTPSNTATPIPTAVNSTWNAAASMLTARTEFTMTLLGNGQVLAVGGLNNCGSIADAELYNPTTNAWSAAGSMAVARNGHTATLLQNGRVLVAGGADASAELYNPTTNAWSVAGSMAAARTFFTATLLTSGKVLVVGGQGSSSELASAELYDPTSNTWASAGTMTTSRLYFTATLLNNGQVLVAGGVDDNGDVLNTAELYNPSANTWNLAAALSTPRYSHSATLLNNGQVLVVGGVASDKSTFLNSAELYNPTSNTWNPAAPLVTARDNQSSTLLSSGQVLVAGGATSSAYLSSAELYDPTSNLWTSAGAMLTARVGHSAALLSNGQVLVAGGNNGNGYLSSAELFNYTSLATSTPTPTITLIPSKTFTPSKTLVPSKTPSPTKTLVPSKTPLPTKTLVPSKTPLPTKTPTPSKTPSPTKTATP